MDKVKAYYKPASGQLQPVKPYLHRPATGGTPAITAPLTAYFAKKADIPTISINFSHSDESAYALRYSSDDGVTWSDEYYDGASFDVQTSEIKFKLHWIVDGIPAGLIFRGRLNAIDGTLLFTTSPVGTSDPITDNFNFTENTTIYIRGV